MNKIVKLGDRFFYEEVEYILACNGVHDRQVSLINLKTGWFFANPVIVKDYQNISELEFSSITHDRSFKPTA